MATDRRGARRALVEEMGRQLEERAGDEDRIGRLVEDVMAIGDDPDLSSVLQKIVETAAAALNARHCALGVLDEHGHFSDLITTGVDASAVRQAVGHLPHGEGILGRLIREPGTLRAANLADEPDAVGFPAGHPIMHTLLGCPILVRDTVYGNLYLTDRRDGEPFSAADEALASALSDVAGGAIENARHHDRLKKTAEELQRRLMPDLPDLRPLQVQARYRPAHRTPHIGGDWYQAVPAPDGTWCVVIGDVMGHDTRSALTMHKISSMLSVLALSHPHAPAGIVQDLEQALHRTGSDTLCTMVVASLTEGPEGSWRLRWTNAGHPPPLLLTPAGEAVYLDTEEVAGIMIGVDPTHRHMEYEQVLEPGSTLLLYTDGLVEDPRQTLDTGLADLARHAASLAAEPLDRLCDELTTPKGRHRSRDDLALLTLHVPLVPGS